MFGYGNSSSGRAVRKKLVHPRRKALDILTIQLRPSCCLTFSLSCSGLAVGQTFFFCLIQRLGFDQQTLAFIPFPGPTPLQNDSDQGRVFSRASGKGCIAGR
jgi:hypothetical protein